MRPMPAQPTQKRRRAHPGCLGLVFVAVAVFAVEWGFDAFIGAPWAHSLGGRPTLTGRWIGHVGGATDDRVVLEIIRGSGRSRRPDGSYDPLSRERIFDYTTLGHHPTLHGSAIWCRNGIVSRYTLYGWATTAGDVTITFNLPIPPALSGPELSEVHGHWSESTLVLAGPMRLYVIGPGTARVFRPAPTATTVTLHPGETTSLQCSL